MTYRFGVFEFRPDTADLWRTGIRVRIEPQPAKALATLLERAGEIVTREDMRGRLWGSDTHVDFDRGLAYCIGQVRTALGDTADNPRFVQTVPKRGYRFIAPVQLDPAGEKSVASELQPALGVQPGLVREPEITAGSRRGTPIGWWAAALATLLVLGGLAWAWSRQAAERPIVAVAVFDNETGIEDLDRFATSTADVMVQRLTQLGPAALGVIGNAPSVRAPRAERDPAVIRRQTGADYLVLGQLQNGDSGLRMVVHLIRLDDATHMWVTRLEGTAADLPGIEERMADRLSEAVQRHVVARDPDAPRSTP